MVSVSAHLIAVMEAETALMAVMRLDVVSYQTIQGGVGMGILTVVIVRYESCDMRGNQGI